MIGSTARRCWETSGLTNHPLHSPTDLFNDDFSYKRKLKIKLPTPDGVVSGVRGGRDGWVDRWDG